ncbi:MAG: BglI family type II restriction endonuclease [Ardenticatenales bacterium]|nr:BglI family type II restriction endonuclease [Ardenticatenales bacterium]
MVEDISTLTEDQIEDIEKQTTRWLFQAVLDFGLEAYEIFLRSPDEVQDIAEDVTRELLDRLSGYTVPQRIYGTVDYKKARYVILPERLVRQALFVDSKAEKSKATATIQMSQISLHVRQIRAGSPLDEPGLLPKISVYNGKQYLTTTAFLHFNYAKENEHLLKAVTVCCLPNGLLQGRYNPNALDSFWRAGRDAPTLGEDFRVRVNFDALKSKANWRVQRIEYHPDLGQCIGVWSE